MPPVITTAQAGSQRHARQQGGAGGRHVGVRRGQLRFRPCHVRAAHQQCRGQPGIQRRGPQRHHAACRDGHLLCLPQQHAHRGLRLGPLLLQQGQAALLCGHQPALLGQVQRRSSARPHPGVHQLQQAFRCAQIGLGNVRAFAQRHRLQPGTGHACRDRQAHGVAVMGTGPPRRLGRSPCRPVAPPEVQFVAGRQAAPIARAADRGLATEAVFPARLHAGGQLRQQRSPRQAGTGSRLVHTGGGSCHIPAVTLGLGHQGIEFGAAQAAPPGPADPGQAPLWGLLPLRRQGRRPVGGVHHGCGASREGQDRRTCAGGGKSLHSYSPAKARTGSRRAAVCAGL